MFKKFNWLLIILPVLFAGMFTGCFDGTFVISEDTVITETTAYDQGLTIEDGVNVTAADGYTLVLTVNAVETEFVSTHTYTNKANEAVSIEESLTPGTYTGKVVITVIEMTDTNWAMTTSGPFGNAPLGLSVDNGIYTRYMSAIYIDADGVYQPAQSVEAAVKCGKVSSTEAKNVHISSVGEQFSSIIVDGGEYTIKNSRISQEGNALNDFQGQGFGVRVANATVNIENSKIESAGVVRGATWVTSGGVLNVKNSKISVYDGILPEDEYAGMWGPPWYLGITGNCRGTLVVGNGEGNYENSTISAEGWGALSTDSGNGTLNAKNCKVNVTVSGYGAYNDGFTDTFKGCEFNVTDYALIMTGGNSYYRDGCKISSERFGLMLHGCSGGLEVSDSSFNVGEAGILLKSSSPSPFTLDNTSIKTGNGIIAMFMFNEDANYQNCSDSTDFSISNCTGRSALVGDIFNSNIKNNMTLNITLDNSALTGAITLAEWTPELSDDDIAAIQAELAAGGWTGPDAFSPDAGEYAPFVGEGTVAYKYIEPYTDTITTVVFDPMTGEFTEVTTTAEREYALNVSLTGASTWKVKPQVAGNYVTEGGSTSTLYLTGLSIEAGSKLAGNITVTVDDVDVTAAVTSGAAYSTSGLVKITVE